MIKRNVLSNDFSVINYCPPMYNKNDFEIITNLANHQTGKSFLVQTVNTPKKYQYELRIMYKNKIIELNEMALVFYEKKFRPKVRHPFLVNTICTFQDNENLYLISEMPLGGYFFNLLNALGKLSLKATKFYIAEMLLAMHHLHRKGRCYYHLIPSNIMLDKSGHIKLKYDFMNLGGLDDDSYNNNVEYIGIEYILEKKVTFVSDYWSLGVIMYELLFGYSPFRGCTIEETINNVKYSKFTMPPDVDLETEDLIRMLLCRHTFSKMNCMNAFMCIKNHRFFTNIDWYAIENKEILPPLAHMVKPKEVFRGVPMNVFSATKTKKRDHDGYLRLFRSYSFVDDYDCKYEMDLN